MPAIVVPFRPKRPSELKAVKVLGGSGFPPPAFAVLARTTDDVPEDLLLLSLEVPSSCALPPGLDKEGLERLCVDRLIADLPDDSPGRGWSVVGRGDDPPDFILSDGTDRAGLELTTFTSQARRQAHAEFRRVRAALLEAGPLGFEHLRGHLIYFWVDSADRPGTVAKAADRASLIRGIREFSPQPNPLGDDPNEPFPEVMPDMGTGTAEPWRFLAVPWNGPPSPAFTFLGFDIGICLESSHTADEAGSEARRIIGSHDASGCDILAIQVGSPDQNGLIYPTDEVIMDLAFEDLRGGQVPLRHIRRVLVHYWRRGEVVEIPVKVAP